MIPRHHLTCALVSFLAAPLAAQDVRPRTEGVYLVPTLTIGGSYDDNLFFSSTTAEESFFGRSTQGVGLEFLGKTLKVELGYSFESQVFPGRLDDLTDVQAGQRAQADLRYETARTRFNVGAGYTSTQNPRDLIQATGLDLGRVPSENYTGSVGFRRRLSPKNTWDVDYEFSLLQLANALARDSVSHSLGTGVSHQRSKRTSIELEYTLQQYRYGGGFFAFGADENTTLSHVVALGMKRQVGARTNVTLAAGPRATRVAPVFQALADGSADWEYTVDVRASLGYRREKVDLSITFGRSQQQLFGLSGFADTESLVVGVSFRPQRRVRLSFSPGAYRNERDDFEVWTYGATCDANLQMAEWLSLRGTYVYTRQDGRFSLARATSVLDPRQFQHNVVTVALVFGRPFRL